jgi:tetratricopeptide (TPR) repeat protein
LEGYRMPRRLVASEGERGAIPARLAPIFRDREELPAAGDLSEKVRAALTVSDHLIVVCSPDSAASLWVAREVAAFRELRPGRPILAAIVRGEPPHCFPRGLVENGEPLAADLRPGGDGRRLGFLKLVAGLAGVGLDRLVQRDAARRVRRVTAVTGGAVAAMLAMAVMTTMAFTARKEAQRQRAEAEGLVEFMLTDLRVTLKGVGRLDALGAANAKALSYYASQDVEALGEESLGRRARIQHAIGDDALASHDIRRAALAFVEAQKTTAEQIERHPGNPGRWIEYIKSLNGLGRVSEMRDEWGQANDHYRAAAQAADRLVASAPENPDFLMRAAAAAVNLGNVCFTGTRDYAGAERHYNKAVALLRRAAKLRPRDPHVLMSQANALGWLADSFFMRDLWRQSLAARRQQLAIVQPLYERRPDNAEYTFRLAAAERGLAHSLSKAAGGGDVRAGVLEHLMRARTFSRRLSALDPRNKDWKTLATKLQRDFNKPEFRLAGVQAVDSPKHQTQEVVR